MKATRTSLRTSPRSRLAILLVIGLVVVGCGSAGSAGPNLGTTGSAVDQGAAPVPAASAGPAYGGSGSGSPTGNGNDPQLYDAARPDLLIIKTGTMDLQVKDVPAAAAAGATAIRAVGGYVSASQQTGDGDGLTASVTYRIPSAQWDAALATLRSLAIKVVNEATQTQDV
ncbi:MAG: DUF4349 domain-containing protein, partial [Chloroflexota bacterium]